MFVMAETIFTIVFKDEATWSGSSANGQKLVELEDRLVVEEGKKRIVFFNNDVDHYTVEEKELDTTGLDLEIKV